MLNNDSANSYDIFPIIGLVVFIGMIYLVMSIPVNDLTDENNVRVSAGDISEQSATYYSYGSDLWYVLPGVFLLGLIIWAYNRSNARDDIGED